MTPFCPYCGKPTPASLVDAVVSHVIRGVEVKVAARLVRCGICGNEFNSPELGQDLAAMALDAYRGKAGLLTPDRIREFRAAFDLTQQELARLLGWGPSTLSRYENGAIQDEAHDRALRMIMRPETLLAELMERPQALAPERRQRIMAQLRGGPHGSSAFRRYVEQYVTGHEPDLASGFRAFDPARYRSMVLHFCKAPGVPRTKLDRLLWYSDLEHFRVAALSMSGSRYVRQSHGPTPVGQDTLMAWLIDADKALTREEMSEGPQPWIHLVSLEAPDYTLFSNRELALLAQVAERFKDTTARAIGEISRREDAFLRTGDGEVIGYGAA